MIAIRIKNIVVAVFLEGGFNLPRVRVAWSTEEYEEMK